MAVPSDRKRRPFLLSLSLFLLLSALLVLAFLFLDPSPQSLPSRLSAPTLPPPPQQQSLTLGNPPHSQPNAPAAAKAEVSTDTSQPDATTAAAKADENTDPSRSNATTGVEDSGDSDSTRPDNSSDATAIEVGRAEGKAVDTGVDAAEGNGRGDDVAVAEVRWETCRVGRGVSAADYIPCLDNVRAIKALHSRRHMEHRERHCPVVPRPRCLVPMPAGYRPPVPWPRSRDMIWYNNVPHPKLVEYKKDQNWVIKSGDYLVFPGGGTQFKAGVTRYIQLLNR